MLFKSTILLDQSLGSSEDCRCLLFGSITLKLLPLIFFKNTATVFGLAADPGLFCLFYLPRLPTYSSIVKCQAARNSCDADVHS